MFKNFIRNVTLDFNNPFTICHLYKTLLLTYRFPMWRPKTEIDLKNLISIEHEFLRCASTKTPNPMHFFNHDYTQIRSFLKIESFRSTVKKIDYLVAFQIANEQYNSNEVNNLFISRSIKHNLKSVREIKNDMVKPNYIGNFTSFRLRGI